MKATLTNMADGAITYKEFYTCITNTARCYTNTRFCKQTEKKEFRNILK